MKLRVPCMQCIQESGHANLEIMSVELRDDGLLVAACSNSHTTITAIQEQKYELLFELAIMALLDGYPREAATGMAASLERFYEFATRVICDKHKVDATQFESTWELVVNQSERQFGGFLFSYLLESGSLPSTIDNKKPAKTDSQTWKSRTWKEFRNSIVHKGYLPSSAESMVYGELIFNHIMELTCWLKSQCSDSFERVAFGNISNAYTTAQGKVVSTMSIPTILSSTRHGSDRRSFASAVAELKTYKQSFHHP